MKSKIALSTLLFATSLLAFADDVVIKVVAKDTGFEPAQLDAPAGTPFYIEVNNAGSKAIEFESKPLRVEKVVAPGKTVRVKVGSLHAGSYKFVNEFNEEKVNGVVVVK